MGSGSMKVVLRCNGASLEVGVGAPVWICGHGAVGTVSCVNSVAVSLCDECVVSGAGVCATGTPSWSLVCCAGECGAIGLLERRSCKRSIVVVGGLRLSNSALTSASADKSRLFDAAVPILVGAAGALWLGWVGCRAFDG